ncbi:MAG TPA: hypothetical protein VKV19_19595 [Ktedonobacteraceae bacterium]|nr:hypothetical protein [Ktedonobacteraceae bacterium]
MAEISEHVQRVFALIVRHLGRAFSLDELILFTAGCRGKPLMFEQKPMPVALSGYCLALQDVDLIVTRANLDDILTQAVKLHEISHLLLQHLPMLSDGPATPTYAAFQRHESAQTWVTRNLSYDDPQEQEAELLATLLLDCISRQGAAFSALARDIYGW